MRQKSLVIQEQHEANMRLHHKYYSRIECGHGVRDIVRAHTKPKVAVEANTGLRGCVDVRNWIRL